MPLEATMIVIDNSSWQINGDYAPSRFAAQCDAVNTIFRAKTNSNPENVVGLMTMAGRSPEVLVTPTQEHGKLLAAMHEVKLSGEPDMPTGINVAQLALKHRQNKNQRQRIVVLVGSPLESASSSEDALVKLAKKMKKNNVAIDVVAFGDALEYDSRLTAFIGAANSSDNSHFVTVPAGAGLLSDHIVSSNLLAEDGVGGGGGAGDGAGPSGAGAGGADDDGFGVDPNLDPELAMALRMSLEEERARVAASSSSGAAAPSLETIAEGSGSAAAATSAEVLMDVGAGNSASGHGGPSAAPVTPAAPSTAGPTEGDAHAATPNARPAVSEVPPAAGGPAAAAQGEEMDPDLALALQLSQQEEEDGMDVDDVDGTFDGTFETAGDAGDDDEDDDDEEAQLARALAMSMEDAKQNEGAKK